MEKIQKTQKSRKANFNNSYIGGKNPQHVMCPLCINEPFSVKRGLGESEKSTDPEHKLFAAINFSEQTPFLKQALVFMCLHYKSFKKKKIVEKKEKLLVTSNISFSQCLLPIWRTFCNLNLKLLSANSFSLEESKVCHIGKG